MNRTDYARMSTVTAAVDALLNAGLNPSILISNLDVLEALLDDMKSIQNNRPPSRVTALLLKDERTRAKPCCEHCIMRCDGDNCKCHL